MIEKEVCTVLEALEQATKLIGDWSVPSGHQPYPWFRGVKNAHLELLPGAYWRGAYEETAPLVAFSQEAGAYANVGSIDDWDTYYLAQHHGIPTRLLDWTESFVTALFFAVDGWAGETEPCIWLLDPNSLNKLSIKWYGIISPNNFPAEMNRWLPKEVAKPNFQRSVIDNFTYDNRLPVAIYPRKSNQRIVAQRGTFTIHGKNKISLNKFLTSHSVEASSIVSRIVFRFADVDAVRRDLKMLGITRSSIYPDLQNYVQQLKEDYQW